MNEELKNIATLNNLELVQYFQDNLIVRATGGGFEQPLFNFVRLKLLQDKSIEHILPKWIKQQRTVEQFWAFIKPKYSTYQERKEFLWSEFAQLLNYLETKKTSPLDEIVIFDESHIHVLWMKAVERKETDPEGAITAARTLIESVLKYILDEQKKEYNDNTDLSELYKEVAKSLNLAPEQHQEPIFKQILGGANGIISGLGSLRNKLGDAHGKTKNHIKPKSRHGELAVNLAGTMATFLYRTYVDNTK